MRAKALKIILAGLIFNGVSYTVNAEEKFRVCADPLHPPYSTNKLDGFENKIAALFAKELGQTLEYTWFPERIGFIRNTLNATIGDSEEFKCDVIMGVPAGSDRTLNTVPYYHTTYLLVIAKNRGWDDISSLDQLTNLPLERQQSIRIAMFDRGPGTTWLQQAGLLDVGIPYQTMSGDNENNTAMQIEKDLKAGKIDMAILWGPMAGYVLSQSPINSYTAIPMISSPQNKFDFSIAMGVRYGDKARKEKLNQLIHAKSNEIKQILSEYNFPLLQLPVNAVEKEDDDD
ncbi:MAG: quinoprotein dehydrogenase-associated putative ABC transporter substrate-binding protein [Methylicorpusculum sp.]|uniref:quinoprotein dehydrogenase-associated putative ABC transporter substrate-binding protein n=1 Tax=Methylicorpusculum sp. TaxID=2713644 RepID=UPI002727352E|nr:quinoprotein dehydrogenase-associated putative ABC transporter substrate-binding protein [Methylicorpusculum sp.]MDO8939194.1 quinoprotein dehydrogenase-associated putative ABC transporter substrate-binding protein [Methylicorpusculum sp.]MDP2201605.1 quinoprotein dehydrogenase-associated putative ABC transporter substrate-binding protein [Methylicorpusculum sp.]